MCEPEIKIEITMRPNGQVKRIDHPLEGPAVEIGVRSLDQLSMLLRAWVVFIERDKMYNGNWRRQGWRGNLFKLRLKVERAWDVLWGAKSAAGPGSIDDLLDVINYAAMTAQLADVGERDGEWSYPDEV